MTLSVSDEDRLDDLPRVLGGGQEDEAVIDLTNLRVVVTGLQIPFFRLSWFFFKAVLAAIPALLLAVAIIWGLVEGATHLFPMLTKLKLLIYLPDAPR